MRTLSQPSESAELRKLARRVFNLERARGEARVARAGDKMLGRLVGPTGLDPISPDEYARKAYIDALLAEPSVRFLVDAKGDLLVGTAPDTLDRLPIGTGRSLLSVNADASAGVSWEIRPIVRRHRTTGFQEIPNAADTPVFFNSTQQTVEPGEAISKVEGDYYVRAIQDGWYEVGFSVKWAQSYDDVNGIPRNADTGQRSGHLIVVPADGTPAHTIVDDHQMPTAGNGIVTNGKSRPWAFKAGDRVRLDVLQQLNPPGPLNLLNEGHYSPQIWLAWLRPL